ncbi:MAG: 50S ribosomal protein L23 [Proteobacteria bacterium]|nr:50S ribosomal protein L23 [Pseudomonadota bacterium]
MKEPAKKEAVKEATPKKEAVKKPEASSKKGEAVGKPPSVKDYNTIVRPVITEKATQVSAHGQVVFQVLLTASKSDIRDAVQNLFKVKVLAVNTSCRKGKMRSFRGRAARRGDMKLAYVTLAEGHNIDMSAGI